MRWLVAIDDLVADGTLSAAQAAEMKRRSRAEAAALGIGVVQVGGVAAATVGAMLWAPGPAGLALSGLLIFAAGVGAVAGLGDRLRLPAHAAVVIGLALSLGGLGWFLDETMGRGAPQMLVGAAVAAAGVAAHARASDRYAFIAGMSAAAGLAMHLWGLFGGPAGVAPTWAVVVYAAVAVLALGVRLDVRLLSGLSVPLFAAAFSTTGYTFASYSVTIYEATLTIAEFAAIAAVCLLVTRRGIERWSRHARIVGLLAFVWINMAFWIGSLWGDVVGAHVWGPLAADGGPATSWEDSEAAWRDFSARALTIPPHWFAVVWAALLLATGLWAALTDRRPIFNAAAAFGAVHFYTQWFETFGDHPAAMVAAGVIAIGLAWAARAATRGPSGGLWGRLLGRGAR